MKWMIYGANGYTGELIAREAGKRGHQPVLAGRSAPKIESLGRELGLDLIAEGVETASQADRLFEEGCALLQGFHFSPALPTAEFEAWVRRYDKAGVAQPV